MARKNAVWGIDIGLCSIKALRCVPGNSPGELIADRFDFIEFPKMLNQPEVDADEQIQEALRQFLSRNNVLGDQVAVSVPGQSGLSRFFRPPPVDQKTLPDIVKYEVKQQIPFPIEDVIWDWQKLGGVEVDGRLIDAEVGLFAMKRDGVFRAMKPFDNAGIAVDIVQLSPLAVFNFACHEIFKRNVGKNNEDALAGSESSGKSVVVMSIGTDTTDLIITNGSRLWLRNIPVGGNHFTKQLSRELKLTHAKAEQLKKNLRQAEDPRQLLQAMRPVFNDLVNEVQRSITFFRSLDKTAEISQMVLLGNTAQLPGLRQYLGSQLEIDMTKIDSLQRLTGPGVVDQGPFQENLLSFAPAYGLCLQAANQSRLKTNLLPREIQVERIIDAKKPWILTAVSFLLLGAAVGLLFAATRWYRVSEDFAVEGKSWSQAVTAVDSQVSTSKKLVADDEDQKTKLANLMTITDELTSSSQKKSTWIELYSAIKQALPVDARIGDQPADPEVVPFEDRTLFYVDHIESEFYNDLVTWQNKVQPIFYTQQSDTKPTDANSGSEAASTPAPLGAVAAVAGANPALPAAAPLQGPGWVIELRAHHFHNSDQQLKLLNTGLRFVLKTAVDYMQNKTVVFPGEPESGGGEFQYSDIGVFMPTVVRATDTPVDVTITLKDKSSSATPGNSSGMGGVTQPTGANAESEGIYKVKRADFALQFAWQPRTPEERVAARAKRQKAEEDERARKEAEAKAASTDVAGT